MIVNRRKTAVVLGLLLGFAPLVFAQEETDREVEPQQAPNILVMIADDLGWNDVGFHSGASTTPNLDKLATQGTELRRFYTYPVCSPARAAFLSGLMPRRFGLTHVVGKEQPGLPADIVNLPRVLASNGYHTSLIGKWHLGKRGQPTKSGFDHFYGFMGAEIDYFKHTSVKRAQVDWQRNGRTIEEEGYSTDLLVREAVKLLRETEPSQPFYMQIAFNAPHIPLAAPAELVEKHAGGGGLYAAVIEAMDQAIGNLLAELDALKFRENTLVVFFSDNGADVRHGDNRPFRDGKTTLYEGGIRTPCVLRWPNRIRAGVTSEQPISVHDLFPTLAAAAGLTIPADANLDGTNQWPAIQSGQTIKRSPFLIATSDLAMIDGNWKLIEESNGVTALYHLRDDPSESTDLQAIETGRFQSMKSELDQLKQGLPTVVVQPKGARKEKGKKGKGKK
ncbi:MAG: arylsulfatase [Verrucomicrobiota bacterium]